MPATFPISSRGQRRESYSQVGGRRGARQALDARAASQSVFLRCPSRNDCHCSRSFLSLHATAERRCRRRALRRRAARLRSTRRLPSQRLSTAAPVQGHIALARVLISTEMGSPISWFRRLTGRRRTMSVKSTMLMDKVLQQRQPSELPQAAVAASAPRRLYVWATSTETVLETLPFRCHSEVGRCSSIWDRRLV